MGEKTLEQKRAMNALECVERVKGDPKVAGRYRSYVESLPAHILMGGLGQAVATELAAARLGEDRKDDAGRRAHAQLVQDLEAWLGQQVYPPRAGEEARSTGWLIRAIVEHEQTQYLRAQAEALAWLVWLKKLCQAHLPKAAEE